MAQLRKPLQFKAPRQPQPELFAFPQGYAGGINISTTPDLIALNESPDMLNMNFDTGGVPAMRYGFAAVNETAWGDHPVRGMFEYEPTEGTYVFLVAWNGKLWSVAADGTKTDLCTGAKATIADAQVDFFVMNGKCYFLTGTEYCYYDGTNPVAEVTGKAPLIFTGLAPAGTGGMAYEQFNFLSNSWKVSYSGTAGTTEYVLPAPMTADSIEKVWVNGTETTGFSLGVDQKTVTFASAPGEGTDNVIIQPTKAGLMDATVITKCRFHALYGGKDDTRVFLSGNPNISNGRYHSGLFDPTYFPENGEVLIGSDADAVTGMGRVSDYLLTLKENQIYYTDIEAADTTVIFPVRPMNDEHGCCSWRTIAPVQGGILALSYEGVVWCVPSSVRGQLNARIISKNINRGVGTVTGILQESRAALENAFAYVWRNKYLLYVGNRCWVLDLDYSALAQGVCCWYPHANGLFDSLTQMFERHDGLLWMGNGGGIICKSSQQYNDLGTAIEGYWTSPLIYGSRNHLKRFHNLHITYGSQAMANHSLYIMTDDGAEPVLEISFEDSRAFSFDDIDFDNWTFGSSPYPEPVTEKLNLKAVWIQWRIYNHTPDQGLRILSQALTYSIVKELK